MAGDGQPLGSAVSQKPDSTLEELRTRIADDLGITISAGALWNTLRRMNLRQKKSR